MFLKSLIIKYADGTIIREIPFSPGLNLIIDETPTENGKETGNNVGKTTVLKLIDFCLGANAKGIYTDPENQRNEYKLVKDFLVENSIVINLILKEDLNQEDSQEVSIERNFLARKKKIQRINGVNKGEEEFEKGLTDILFPGHYGNKPTFRQIIAHNVRYQDQSLNNTIKHLDKFTRDDEYETLFLFLLGCEFEKGVTKQELRIKIDVEEKFKRRLESNQTKSAYETALSLLNMEIEDLNHKKSLIRINPDFEGDLKKLNAIKFEINRISSEIGRLEIRKGLISEAEEEIKNDVATIDLEQLKNIYQQATTLVTGIQKTFNELYEFHNSMIKSKLNFVVDELPKVLNEISSRKEILMNLLNEEKKLNSVVLQSESFNVLEEVIVELNSKYKKKGEYENTLQQLHAVEEELSVLNKDLSDIDNGLFSDEFLSKIQRQLNEFNKYFAAISYELYGEKYALKVDMKTVKGRRLYQFTTFNTNFSSGKKQGEISCFDIAYTLFADNENIPCMHFLLNDKRELMHDNQLVKIANLVNAKGIQFVASILKDKLPDELNKEEYIAVKLSQNEKLFRIEK
jgi:uncharacterized protein YydD (DUF2326 family)